MRILALILLAACGLLAVGAGASEPTAAATPAVPKAPRPLPDTTDGIHVFNDQLSGLSPQLIAFAASHYAGAQKMTRADADTLRARNPRFVILHYRLGYGLGYRTTGRSCTPDGDFIGIVDGTWVQEWPGDAVVQESWFYHYRGSRVFNCVWGWYLMDLDDPGWRTWWSDRVLAQLAANDDDGLFADSLSVPNFRGGDGYSPVLPRIDSAFESAWSARMERFIAYVQSRFAGRYHLIANAGAWLTGRDRTDYSGADGLMVEGFGFDTWTRFGARDWAVQLDRALGLVNQGKAIIGQSYRVDDAAGRLFTIASYLLIKGPRTYVNLEAGMTPEWWPEYDIPIGAPSAPPPANVAALFNAASGVFARAYDNGLVLINPGAETRTITLEQTYYLSQPTGGGPVPVNGVLPASWTLSYTPATKVAVSPGRAAILVLNPNRTGVRP